MASITGSELLAKSLKAQGMDTLFYLMGGPMLETESACIKLGVRAIDSRHEQGASMMAHAYSRLTRRPGVCMASSGPGTINMATGVANAFIDAAPLVAVGGTSPRVYFGMDAFQEVDQLSLFKPITKWATRILDAKRIPDVVATAFRQATSGRPGPVFLDLPGDILGEVVDESSVTMPAHWKPAPRAHGDPAAIAEAVALLARAERPLVLGGCCCSHVGAVEGLATRHDRLAVVWFDAHADFHTPDSSRYWLAASYAERFASGEDPETLDKDFLRRWIMWAAVRWGALTKADGRQGWWREAWRVALVTALALPIVAPAAAVILMTLPAFYVLELLVWLPLQATRTLRMRRGHRAKKVNQPVLRWNL